MTDDQLYELSERLQSKLQLWMKTVVLIVLTGQMSLDDARKECYSEWAKEVIKEVQDLQNKGLIKLWSE